ncbi:MAG TPA: Gfo/Idh/MocA family oxidoreductase [Phycisphaerales bacterium]|nr:Gfo/Idh/MocA family oxidoreductase [Phycisphaerales bacterium]
MENRNLKTGVLGLDGIGQALLGAVAGSRHYQVVAVADKDLAMAERVAEGYECEATDDYRQLVIQNELDCLLVGAPLYSCEGQIRAALKKGVHVFKPAPGGRSFEEAAELVRLAEEASVQYVVGIPERFAGSFMALRQRLESGHLGAVSLITAFSSLGEGPYPTWQSDPKLAGGGILLQHCYGLIDAIVGVFGLPDQVYALMTNRAADKQQRLYLTEDTAVVTMRFGDSRVGEVVASQRMGGGRRQAYLRVYGRDAVYVVSDAFFRVYDADGQVIEELDCGDGLADRVGAALEDFAMTILRPQDHTPAQDGRESLQAMAVIESAYLSSRTGFPEAPGRVLEMG